MMRVGKGLDDRARIYGEDPREASYLIREVVLLAGDGSGDSHGAMTHISLPNFWPMPYQ